MHTKKTLASGLLVMLSAAVLAAPVAHAGSGAEVSASVGVANMYLWRGIDLGDGDAAVSGDLKIGHDSGAYAGVWGSSGDASWGTEYDLYAGWGGKVGNLDVDASLWTYAYPDGDKVDADGKSTKKDPGELVDAVISVGSGPVNVTLYEALEGDDANEYRYVTAKYTKDKYSAMYGQHMYDKGISPGHIQLGYQYNDNLSFAVSQFVTDADTGEVFPATGKPVDDNPQFLVSYSIPLTK
ncbi:MAG: TorF family putative porin [Candidatus Thiothrix putei]|uniref:TorF family putative porin n=1 Tax=Candidatus Thiothrix putei TaxID=3080811 RepID=A0AA95HCG8_9GAMM|nr:MAG: TorF family putative porin [Candidatus Thiothrix putei]